MRNHNLQDVSSFLARVNQFKKDSESIAQHLDELVETSVYITWKHGDISPVNAVIAACAVMKGLNRRALVTFYRDVVPFIYSTEHEQFTKADANKVTAMGGILGNGQDDACGPKIMEILASTLWHSFNKEKVAKPYVFNVQRIISALNDQLRKGLNSRSLDRAALTKLNNTVGALVKEFNDKLDLQNTETSVPATAIASAMEDAA